MKTFNLSRRAKSFLKKALAAVTFIGALAVAGNSDYRDELLEEAENNGIFFELAAEYPDKTEGEILDIYEQRYK